jgi:HSP20 family protein
MKKAEKVPVQRTDKALQRRAPSTLFDQLRREMDDFWARPWLSRAAAATSEAWMPSIDVFRKNGDLVLKADLPGMKKEDVTVELDDGDLVVRGERKDESEVEEKDFYRCERSYGSFFRRVPLAAEIDAAKIQAEFKDGVLEVHVPMPVDKAAAAQPIAIS